MIPTTAQATTFIKSAPLWSPTPLQSTQPQLIAHWEKDSHGKLYCRWIKV